MFCCIYSCSIYGGATRTTHFAVGIATLLTHCWPVASFHFQIRNPPITVSESFVRWPLSAILALCSSPYFLFQLPAFFSSFQLVSPSFSPLAFFTFSPSFFHFLPQLFSLSPPAFFHFLPQLFSLSPPAFFHFLPLSSALQGSPVDNLDKLRACARVSDR